MPPHTPIVPKMVELSSTGILKTGQRFGTMDRSCGTPYRDSGVVSLHRCVSGMSVIAAGAHGRPARRQLSGVVPWERLKCFTK